jgi:DNA replication and repair protein RecF
VRICSLTLRPFRNFASLTVQFGADHCVICAGNGRGKSNLLEAISYLSIGKSVRGAQDGEVVPHGGVYFDIEGLCDDGRGPARLRLFYDRATGKTAFRDGAPLPRVADVVGHFRSVHFSPADVALVLRSPAERRRLLDILLSQASADYLDLLLRYQRALAQRNRVLREYRGGAAPTGRWPELEPWSEQLASHGGAIRARRHALLISIGPHLAGFYRQLGGENEELSVRYRGGTPDEPAAMAAALIEELDARRPQECLAGHTTTGPHRDDLLFTLSGQPAETYASAGQLKSILIAWKMAEMLVLESPAGNEPVLLLDDVLSELDDRRSAALLELAGTFRQVILTSPTETATARHGALEALTLPQ